MTLAIHYLDDEAAPDADAFTLVHGFTQNAVCMRAFAEALTAEGGPRGRRLRIAMVDAPGHGASGHDTADLIDAASLLVDAGGHSHYVGYSMGGRMLLHAALLFPEQFRSLTLIGATAGIDGAIDRASRLTADDRLARRLERDGLEAFLDFWLGLELFATLPTEAACRQERLHNREAGLAASLRNCGTGNQFPLWGLLDRLHVPVQVIAGTKDQKFTAIGERMVGAMPNARFSPVVGGHAVHSEAPDEVARLVTEFAWSVESPEVEQPER